MDAELNSHLQELRSGKRKKPISKFTKKTKKVLSGGARVGKTVRSGPEIFKPLPPDATIEEIEARLALLDKQEEEVKQIIATVKESDPFWFFEPNDGELTDDRKTILRRYLKEEDIPQKVDSQLDAILSTQPIRGVSGGNRSSKTVTGTILALIKSTGELPTALEKYREKFKAIIDNMDNARKKGDLFQGSVAS